MPISRKDILIVHVITNNIYSDKIIIFTNEYLSETRWSTSSGIDGTSDQERKKRVEPGRHLYSTRHTGPAYY